MPAPLRLKGLFAFGLVALALGYAVPTIGVASGPVSPSGVRVSASLDASYSTFAPRPARLLDETRVYENRAAHFGERTRTLVVSLPFATREVSDSRLPLGQTAIGTPGAAGALSQVFYDSLVNGDVVESQLVTESTTEPTDQVVLVGAGLPTPTPTTAPAVDLSAAPAAYARAIPGSSTAYCDLGHTATGSLAGPGSIAVDPTVIPLGSHLYIPGYGYGWAVDTGGAIKGNIVDVWLTCPAAIQWGRRQLTIYVLAG